MGHRVAARRVFGRGGYQVPTPSAPVAGGATPFASDTFTDTGSTTLASHVPELGTPWVKHGSSGAAALTISAGGTRLRLANPSSTSIYYITGSPPSAEYDVLCDFIIVGAPTGEASGIAGRINTAANTLYVARYVLASTQWQLAKVVAGTLTDLGLSSSMALTPGQTYAVKLQLRDAAKKLFVDGVELVSSADNAITAAGKAGFRCFTNTVPNDSTAMLYDNFVAQA